MDPDARGVREPHRLAPATPVDQGDARSSTVAAGGGRCGIAASAPRAVRGDVTPPSSALRERNPRGSGVSVGESAAHCEGSAKKTRAEREEEELDALARAFNVDVETQLGVLGITPRWDGERPYWSASTVPSSAPHGRGGTSAPPPSTLPCAGEARDGTEDGGAAQS